MGSSPPPQVAELRRLAPACRARPSLLDPAWAAGGALLGVAAAVAPGRLSAAISGAPLSQVEMLTSSWPLTLSLCRADRCRHLNSRCYLG